MITKMRPGCRRWSSPSSRRRPCASRIASIRCQRVSQPRLGSYGAIAPCGRAGEPPGRTGAGADVGTATWFRVIDGRSERQRRRQEWERRRASLQGQLAPPKSLHTMSLLTFLARLCPFPGLNHWLAICSQLLSKSLIQHPNAINGALDEAVGKVVSFYSRSLQPRDMQKCE